MYMYMCIYIYIERERYYVYIYIYIMIFNELLIPLLVFRSISKKSQKTQNQYFAFLGPFYSFLDNIVVIFRISAKFSTFWSCQKSKKRKNSILHF